MHGISSRHGGKNEKTVGNATLDIERKAQEGRKGYTRVAQV